MSDILVLHLLGIWLLTIIMGLFVFKLDKKYGNEYSNLVEQLGGIIKVDYIIYILVSIPIFNLYIIYLVIKSIVLQQIAIYKILMDLKRVSPKGYKLLMDEKKKRKSKKQIDI